VVLLLLEDPLEMLALLGERLSVILMEDGEDMEEEPSQVKTLLRLIDLLLMLLVGLLRI